MIGRILDLPNDISSFGRVLDEHGEEFTVHGSEIPVEKSIDDMMAYHVDIWQEPSGNVTTLKDGNFGENP